MRLFLSILAISVVLPSVGCSSNLKCRRETALLRAEYLDLEDKYYALLANSGANSAPTIASPGAFVADAQPITQPVIYGSGVQQSAGFENNAMPEIVYYDQSGSYPAQQYYDQSYQGQGYPAESYPSQGYHAQGFPVQGFPVQGETYYSDPPLGPTPSPATSQDISDFGTNLRSSESAQPLEESYYPSPVENTNPREASSNESTDDLPTPDSILENDQSRFDFEIEETQEIGHETKIEMSSPITEVLINKSVSQGKNTDGQPGDEGVEVLIQPKAADGSVVDEAGNLTVSIIDPSADQGERQIGQWTFLKEEALLFFAEDEFDNRGILLDLKWDKKIPTNKRLTVYVRFETSDERIMETTSDIIIDPPSELSIVQQGGDYDSEFVQLEEDEVQGWYKSQTVRGRSEDEDTSGNYNWGRSEGSTQSQFSRRESVRANRSSQPQWRPSR